DLDGDGAPELLLRPTGGRDAPLVRATPDLPQVASSPAARRTLALDPGGEPGLVLTWTAAGETSDAALARFVGGAREEVLRWREGAPLATLSHDLDGDGDRELLIGTGPYTRRVLEVIEEDGRAALRSPAPSLDRRASDVVDLLAADLDDDGRVELVAVLGPWIAYEVRVLRHDPATDTYVDVARRRLGSIDDAVIVRRAGAPPEIAVYRSHLLESPAAFPKERPRGEERGLYRLALRDDALEVVSFSPERAPTGSYRELMAGDLDGDGDDELILGHVGGGGGEPVYGVIEVFASGEVDGAPLMTLSGAMPVHVGDLDGDGDAELVAVIHEQDGDRVWTLGSGEQPLPVARDEPITPPEDALEGAPDRMRRRVQELADMGLDQAAGDVLERVAEMVEEPGDRARLLVAAADQHERRALDRRAARLYARAAREPGVAVEASLGAARALLRLGAHAEALAALAGLEGRRLDDEDARALAALRAELEAMRSRAVVTRFDRPLVGDWQLAQPRAMQRDRVAGTLRVDALTRGPLLSRAVTWDGRRIELALELDVRRVEWGSALHFHLTSGPGDRWADAVISVTGVGGGGERALEVVCAGTGVLDSTRVPIESGARMVGSPRLRVYHVIDRARGESICSVIHGDDEPVDLRSKLGDTPLGDAYRLELFADYASPAWLSADIHRLEARGVEVAEGEPPRSPVASRLVDGDLVGALGALEADTPADLRFAVLSRLGRAEVAREVLREALASEGFAAVRPWLVEALHTRWPESQGVIREVVSPEQRAELIAEAWGQALASEPGDGAAAQALHGGLTDLELGAAPTPRDVERLLLRASAAARLGLDEDARVD
ncbi:MAG: hypothetical protein KC636_39200, partial [Myxococcales bacterium]|nr:hypothetical protein [Myxococcales bacterium]